MSGIRKLADKYCVKEDDGLHVNKQACKESATNAAITVALIGFAVIGGLAVVGLATIGVKTIKTGADTVCEGVDHVMKLVGK